MLDPTIMPCPLPAFDAQGQRIGYGGGYYDRAIARLHERGFHPRLVGIAFDCQEVARVPAEAHDVPLPCVLTESGLRAFPGQAVRRGMRVLFLGDMVGRTGRYGGLGALPGLISDFRLDFVIVNGE